MKYKLLAADMDGTLLNDESVLTERTRSAVRSAIDKGVLFVPSTGRPLRGVEFLNAAFAEDLPFITFNGAVVITGKSKKVLFSKGLEPGFAAEIYKMGEERGLPVVMWAGEELFVSRDCEAIRKYQSITGADMQIITDTDMLRQHDGAGITKMIWLADPSKPAEALRYQTEMNAFLKGRVNCHISRPYMLEFVGAEASKARALEEIGKIYGIDRSEMIAVGDSYNDVSMLEYAGLGIAMQNAPDDIKKICRYVTLSNNEDGVAAAIHKFF